MPSRPILLIAAVTFSCTAFSQSLSIGLIGGVAVTDAFPTDTIPGDFNGVIIDARYFSPAKDYIAGVSIEMRFTPCWSLEGDGMFRELHLTMASVAPSGGLYGVSPSPVVTWEFPVLAKYRFRLAKVSPFVEAGPSFRGAGNLNGTTPSIFGFTAGAGFEKNLRGFKIAPAVRYTRWAPDPPQQYGGGSATTKHDQVELLVGLGPAGESGVRPRLSAVSIGALVGTNLTGAYSTASSGLTNRRGVIAGGLLEVRLPRALSVEVDAINRPIRANGVSLDGDGRVGTFDASIYTWEFPVLAKYRLPLRVHGLQPFAEAGPNFRLAGSLTDSSRYGTLAGTGIEAHLRRIRIAPAIRFTRWGPDRFPDDGGPSRNQPDLLAGVFF